MGVNLAKWGDDRGQGVEGMFQAEGIACAKYRAWTHLRKCTECGWNTAGREPYRSASAKEVPVVEMQLFPGPALCTALLVQATGEA